MSLPNGTVNQNYPGATLRASGCTAPLTWAVSAGALPPGLSLNAQSGAISGTPTQAGLFNFTARVTDSSNPAQSDTESFRITILVRQIDISGVNMTGNWEASIDGNPVNPVGHRVTIRVRPGDQITWRVNSPLGFTHGVVFESRAEMERFLNLNVQASQPRNPALPAARFFGGNGFGTGAFGDGTQLLRATIRAVPQGQELDFTCFVHGPGAMDGTLRIE